MDGMNEERMAREERAERRIKDAITSPKMGNKAVAEACLASLIIRVNLPSYALQPETTPPWKPIAAALTRAQKWTHAARVDWSSGRRWVRAGEG